MLQVKNLFCGYDGIDIVKGVSFNIKRGQNISIVGPNGCGKTTLLKAIANLIEYKGSIEVLGDEVSKLNRKDLARKIGLMTQNSEVYFPYTVYETVSLGRYAHLNGVFSSLSKEDENMVLSCIKAVGMLEHKDTLITELSGGQLQRVYLARVFAQDPDIILLDEPTNHLDLKYQIEILGHINKWTKENNKTVIGVLHDLNLVQMFSEEIIMISNGKVVAKGKTKEVLEEQRLKDVYGVNIKKYMLEALEKWK